MKGTMAYLSLSTRHVCMTLMKSDVAKLKKLMQLQAHQLQRSHCLRTMTAITQSMSLESKKFRKKCFQQIQALHYYYAGSQGAFSIAITTLDFLVSRVQMKSTGEKQIGCLSAACYLIASKFVDDETSATVSSLVTLHLYKWTPDDLRRMEKWVLQKLSWQVPSCTYLTFLQHIYAIINRTGICLPDLEILSRRAAVCMQEDSTLVLKPSSLALGVTEYSLQTVADAHKVYSLIMEIQIILQICDSELYECSSILQCKDDTSEEVSIVKPVFPAKKYCKLSWEGSSELQTITEEETDEEAQLCDQTFLDFCKTGVLEDKKELDKSIEQNILLNTDHTYFSARESSDKTEGIPYNPKTKCHIPIKSYANASVRRLGVSVH